MVLEEKEVLEVKELEEKEVVDVMELEEKAVLEVTDLEVKEVLQARAKDMEAEGRHRDDRALAQEKAEVVEVADLLQKWIRPA